MNFSIARHLRHITAVLALLPLASSCRAADEPTSTPVEPAAKGQWKTAYYKRGFLGPFLVSGVGGANSTIRSRIVLPFDGTKVRVTVMPLLETETVVSKVTLARGKEGEEAGTIEGTPIPLTFKGEPTVTLEAKGKNVSSDTAEAAIKSGVWYLQQSYSCEKCQHAYNVDKYFLEPGDHHDATTLKKSGGVLYPGNVFRVDVWTEDTRPTILCYGDSITHGYGSTPNAGKAYPEVLSRLTGLPTLNAGVNMDLMKHTATVPSLARQLRGVETVIVLIGINDILGNAIKTPKEYSQLASNLIAGVKQNGQKIYIGTITPSGGVKQFDRKPEREVLRQGINTWIREKSKADGVIDFDAALRDPANPGRLKEEYQSDWIHPSDAGYQKMAETAAAVIKPTP